jgi:hypothetical protein
MDEKAILAFAERLPLDKLASIKVGIDEIYERKTNDDMERQINEKMKYVDNYTEAYVDYSYHPATERRDKEEVAEVTLTFKGYDNITINFETNHNGVSVLPSFVSFKSEIQQISLKTPSILGWTRGDTLRLLRILAAIVMPETSGDVVEFINDTYFNVNDVEKGDLEVEPIYVTPEERDKLEYQIYEKILQLIGRSKYDDIEVIYGGTNKDIEEGTIVFYNNEKQVGKFRVSWDKRYNALPMYLFEDINNTIGHSLLGPEKYAVIETLLPYYGKRLVEEERKKGNIPL